jgi:hypothetical protein
VSARSSRIAGLAAALAALVVAPAVASAAPTVTVADSLATVRPDQPASGPTSAVISAARNEFESFQVVVAAGDAVSPGVSVSLAQPLTGAGGTIPAANVSIFREEYLNLRRASDLEGDTGPWPDALIPTVDAYYGEARNAFPVDVPAGQNRVAWIDVQVPADQPAGLYEGALSVTDAAGFGAQVPIQLTVRDFTLPSTSTLASAFGMDFDLCPAQIGKDCFPNEERGWELKSVYVRAALENRVTISDSAFQPPVRYEREWFRQFILPLLQGGSPQNDKGTMTPVRLPGAQLTAISVDGGKFLKTWRKEAAAGGFTDRAFFYACDEPGSSRKEWARCKRSAKSVRGWPDLETLVTASIQELQRFKATGVIDIVVPIVNHMNDRPDFGQAYVGDQRPLYDAFLADPGKRLWLYNACPSHGCADDGASTEPYWAGWPSYVIDQPGFEHRAMGVVAFAQRATGELYFQTTYSLKRAWRNQFDFGGNGDGTLFYPGQPKRIGGTQQIPVESIRLKRIRDGREDYEYLSLLAAAGQGDIALSLAQQLVPTPYSTDIPSSTVEAFRTDLATRLDQ